MVRCLATPLGEVRRILKPGGLLAFSTFGPDTLHDTLALMRDLKAIDAHNATRGRPRGLTGRRRMEKMRAAYETFRRDARLPATFEVLYATASHSRLSAPHLHLAIKGCEPNTPAIVCSETLSPITTSHEPQCKSS
jgi:SAM-dependent methyltransferase